MSTHKQKHIHNTQFHMSHTRTHNFTRHTHARTRIHTQFPHTHKNTYTTHNFPCRTCAVAGTLAAAAMASTGLSAPC
jgi:hypothetical protein